MSTTRFLGGRRMNVLARCASPPVPTDVASGFPITGIYDNKTSHPFRFSTVPGPGVARTIAADLNAVVNGSYDLPFVGGVPGAATEGATWSAGTATLTRNTALPRTGSGCLQVGGTAGVASGHIDLAVVAGESYHLDFAGRKQGGGGAAILRGRDLHTGRYMTSVGGWQAASADVLNNNTTAYTTVSIDTTIEDSAAGMPMERTLRIYFYAGGGAGVEALYDDCFAWPTQLDLAVLVGHNIPQGVTVEILADTTASPTTVRATLTPRLPSFYGLVATPLTQRYVSVKFSNADLNPGGAIQIAELVLGKSLALAQSPMYGIVTEYRDPQVRSATDSGSQQVYLLGAEGGSRVVSLPYRLFEAAHFAEQLDEIIRRTRNGAYPCVVVPQDDDLNVVIFGRLQESYRVTQSFMAAWDPEALVVVESPVPLMVA